MGGAAQARGAAAAAAAVGVCMARAKRTTVASEVCAVSAARMRRHTAGANDASKAHMAACTADSAQASHHQSVLPTGFAPSV